MNMARFIDQIDADMEAARWLEAKAKALGADRVESHCLGLGLDDEPVSN